MLGWTVLFALASMSGLVATLLLHPPSLALKAATIVSSILFVLSLLTRVIGVAHRR
jgi:hypothetical protein